MRREIRELAEQAGLMVQPNIEPDSVVHITIRGRFMNLGIDPPLPYDSSDLSITFDKVGIRRRYAWCPEHGYLREPCGATLCVNFGLADYVRDHISKASQSLLDIQDSTQWPPLASIESRRPQSGHAVSATPPKVQLHESTSFPLENDVEVAMAASLVEADIEAVQRNARVSEDIQRLRSVPEKLVLLELSRDPTAYHEQLQQCDELRSYRDALEAVGKSFILPQGAYAFVRPEQYEQAVKALQLQDVRLTPHHVLVGMEYEETLTLIEVIRGLKWCNGKVKVKRNSKIAVGLAMLIISSDFRIEVKRSFLHVDVSSSLRSVASGEPCTASTTDAHGGQNPRRA